MPTININLSAANVIRSAAKAAGTKSTVKKRDDSIYTVELTWDKIRLLRRNKLYPTEPLSDVIVRIMTAEARRAK